MQPPRAPFAAGARAVFGNALLQHVEHGLAPPGACIGGHHGGQVDGVARNARRRRGAEAAQVGRQCLHLPCRKGVARHQRVEGLAAGADAVGHRPGQGWQVVGRPGAEGVILQRHARRPARLVAGGRAPRGPIRISVPVSFGVRHLAPLVADFVNLYPDVTLDVDYNDRQVNLIESGIDMAVRITGQLDGSNATNSATYGYDPVDRLTGATLPHASYGYTYDATGNRTSQSTGASTRSYSIDPASNRLTSLTHPSQNLTHDPVGSVTADDIIAHCREHLARYKVPKHIEFCVLPKTSTGKIQKFMLRQQMKSATAIG